MKRILAALLLSTSLSFAASAAEPLEPSGSDRPSGSSVLKNAKLKLSGVIFGSYGVDVGAASDAPTPGASVVGNNRFDISRAYINLEPQFSDNISMRITPDLTRVSGTDGNIDGNLDVRLKYAYVNFNELLPGTTLRVGVMQTPYIDFEDSIWKYRVLGASAYETFRGQSSADLGVGVMGKQLGGMLDFAVMVMNGEGYSKPEKSPLNNDAKYKALGGRLTVSPFVASETTALRGLKLTGFFQYEYAKGAMTATGLEPLTATRVMGLASYEHSLGTLGFGYGSFGDDVAPADATGKLSEVSSNLVTAFGYLNLPYDFRLVGRLDRFDADTSKDVQELKGAGSRTRSVLGLAYRINSDVQVVGDWQHFGFEDADLQAKPSDVSDQVLVHLEAKF